LGNRLLVSGYSGRRSLVSLLCLLFSFGASSVFKKDNKNYSSKREDLEEEDQREDERNVIADLVSGSSVLEKEGEKEQTSKRSVSWYKYFLFGQKYLYRNLDLLVSCSTD
jgi:hypothetical protein